MKTVFKVLGCIAFVMILGFAFTGCLENVQEGKGTVSISLSGGERTLLPSQFDLSKLYFVLTFTQSGGGTTVTVSQTGQGSIVQLLDVGTWNLDIKGYASQANASNASAVVVSYAQSGIAVAAGANVPIAAKLVFNQSGMTQAATGTLSYEITIPQGTTGTLTVLTLDGDSVGSPITLSPGVNSDNLELPSGEYNISASMVEAGIEKTWWATAHIYDSAITVAAAGLNDFSGALTGTLSITLSMDDFTMTDEGQGIFNHVDMPIVLNKSEETSTTISVTGLDVIAWRVGSTLLGTGSSITLNAGQFSIGFNTLSLTFTKDGKTWQGNLVFSVVEEDIDGMIEMVWIPAGTFTMGGNDAWNADPAHQVTLNNGFYMGKYQVTQKQWEAVMGTTVEEQKILTGLLYGVGDNYPMYYVNWYDAIVFCNRLSVMENLSPAYEMETTVSDVWSTDTELWGAVPTTSTARWNNVRIVEGSTGYRLPTEAQWEYACRAGSTTAYYWGDETDYDTVNQYALYGNNSNSTNEVGKKLPNAWGLYDMSGNVWEWCWNWYSDYTDTAKTDPVGASSGDYRVNRGGSWIYGSGIENLQSAYRYYLSPYYRSDGVGFRVLRP